MLFANSNFKMHWCKYLYYFCFLSFNIRKTRAQCWCTNQIGIVLSDMKKILVIDDNLLNLKLIFDVLKTDFPNYQIILSQSGIEGIEIAQRELPDIILLDILMPGMDGFEVCNILKNDKTTNHIPILMVSAMNELSFRVKGLNTGADAFISKPFDNAELKAQIKVLLRIKFAEDLLRKRNENLEILIKKQTSEFQDIKVRYSKVTEYILEYFWEVDPKGVFNYISPVVVKILGFDSEEILGKKSLFDFCLYDKNTESKEFFDNIFAQRKNFMGNVIQCLNKNGGKVWLTISGFPIFDSNDNFSGYIGVNHDITKQRVAEEANKNHLAKINDYQKKLKNLYFELSIAEEKERRTIAEYLHDGLGQTISIAAIKLSAIASGLDEPLVKKPLEEISELLREAIAESRTLVYDLSPPILFELGLISAIKWKLEQVENKYGIATIFSSEENSIVLATDIKVLLFRIVCELLNNTIKHADASFIQVELRKNKNNLNITVSDNGKGFEFNPGMNLSDLGGFGLFSINERLDSLQGSLTIKTKTLKGTQMIVIVPI